MATWSQLTRLRINPKYHHRPGRLVFCHQVTTCRFDIKVPGRAALSGLMLNIRQLPSDGIDRIHNDCVVPPIRAVEKFAAWVHAHFGGRKAMPLNTFRQSGNGLDGLQHTRRWAVRKCSYRQVEFINHVRKFTGRMEIEVARPSARFDRYGSCLLYTSPSPRD